MKKYLIIGLLLILITPAVQAVNYEFDLGISNEDIFFSAPLVAGQQIRVYARVHNFGNKDVTGYVTFYQGDILIGNSQVISARARGLADEVFVDFLVPDGSFNIYAKINGQTPKDENPANDVALTSIYIPQPDNDRDADPDATDPDDDNDNLPDTTEDIINTDPLNPDTDGDGMNDKDDDFPTNPGETVDSDGDGIGDNADPDDDNDNCPDTTEATRGTDPKDPDTDGDGVLDCRDAYPLDPDRTTRPVPSPVNTNTLNTNSATNENINTILNLNIDGSTNTNESLANINNVPDESEFVAATDSTGQPIAGSKLMINAIQQNWNTFTFSPELRGFWDDNLTYEWDFGDGTKSNKKIATHQFVKNGNFAVSLKVNGQVAGAQANKGVNISFFNLGNWQFVGFSFSLFVLILVLLISLLRKTRQQSDN